MTVHLVKLAVGVADVADLRAWQAQRLAQLGQVFHRTRMRPKRQDELLDGGSIYWVIGGAVAVRQRVLGLHEDVDGEGVACCRIELDPALVETCRQPHRPFQGWRYLDPADAPADIGETAPGAGDLPPALVEELKRLGLW